MMKRKLIDDVLPIVLAVLCMGLLSQYIIFLILEM